MFGHVVAVIKVICVRYTAAACDVCEAALLFQVLL